MFDVVFFLSILLPYQFQILPQTIPTQIPNLNPLFVSQKLHTSHHTA